MVKNISEMFQTKNFSYFKFYLINCFLYKNNFIEFPVLKDVLNQISSLTRDQSNYLSNNGSVKNNF